MGGTQGKKPVWCMMLKDDYINECKSLVENLIWLKKYKLIKTTTTHVSGIH